MLRSPLSSPLRHPLQSPLAARRGGGYNPFAVFGTDLVTWYGNSVDDLWRAQGSSQTLFQDQETAVSALSQAVGLVLDKSKGLEVGSSNLMSGATSNGAPGYATYDAGSDTWDIYRDASGSGSIITGFVLPANTWAILEFEFINRAGSTSQSIDFRITDDSSNGVAFTRVSTAQNRVYRVFVRAGTALSRVSLSMPNVGHGGLYRGLSLRTIAGNHLYQPTAAARMVLSESAGVAYLQPSAANGWASTAPINLSATSAVTVFSAIRKLSDAAAGRFYEFSADSSSTAGTFSLSAPGSAAANYAATGRGSALSSVTASGFSSPHSATLTQIIDIPNDRLDLRVNGALSSSSSDMGSGSMGTQRLFVGRQNGASAQLDARIYSLPMIVARVANSAEIERAELFFIAP
jgi:hypothetical protein